MTLQFKIDEKDYLTYQLYIASKSRQIKKKRLQNRIIFPILYTVFAIYLLIKESTIMAALFFSFGVLWYFIYPIRERKRYIKYYETFNKEFFKERFGRPMSLEISNNTIISTDEASEVKVATTDIEAINEIATLIFIKLKTGSSFLLPKDKIEGIDLLKKELTALASHLNIPYNSEEDWKWK